MAEYQPSKVAKAAKVAASNGLALGDKNSQRYSVAALWSMAAENDVEVDDSLTKSQRQLRNIKLRISAQSKRNFVLERDVRYLDGRIALLIQNRMALHEVFLYKLSNKKSPVIWRRWIRRKETYRMTGKGR
jgi:Ras GTPase-activating-like protein IQGAP2/3